MCGTDAESGKLVEHRREWIQRWLELLAAVFGVDDLAFGVGSDWPFDGGKVRMLLLRNPILWLVGVVLALSLLFSPCEAAEPPLTVIFDTDAGGDCDDIGALFLLHGAVERGEVKLLATGERKGTGPFSWRDSNNQRAAFEGFHFE